MKITRQQRARQQGIVLVCTLVICAILGILMGSYLFMVKTQSISVARAQAWNSAIAVAEAGVEEAMAQLNTSGATTSNSWVNLGGGTFAKTNYLGQSYYGVNIKVSPAVTDAYPVIVSAAYVPGPISTAAITRTVQVKTRAKGSFVPPGAMVVSTFVTMSGFGITTDSFVSTNLALFPGGLYNSANARDHGDVVTTSSQTNMISVGNGKVKGTVRMGPNGQASTGAGGAVGDMAFVNGGNSGIQAGHAIADVQSTFPDQTLPNTGGKIWLTPVAGSYKINGVTYKYLLNSANPWKIATLDGGVYVNGPGVILQVTSSIAFGSKDEVRITGSGDLSMYVSAPNATIGGNGIINDTGLASKFHYYGLPSNTTLKFGANVAFVGTINAPEADFTLGGGGNNTYDFIGQSITRSASMNGHYNFHYDESIQSAPASAGYTATSWDEL